MFLSNLPALLAFALVSSITPGPNNLMLMASGASFGLRRTLPHLLGISLGFLLMILLVGAGLIGLFDLWPASHRVLKAVSIAYLLWLAVKIVRAGDPGQREAGARPMTFTQAALFQWVNPKAWTMALTAVTVYAPERELATVVSIAFAFSLVNLPSCGLWAVLGEGVGRWLGTPARRRAFNWMMAALLVASLAMV